MAENDYGFNFSDFLESQPQALYQSYLTDPATKMPSSMKRYYQNQFSQIQNEYIGELARQMREGKLPTKRFQDYLSEDVFTKPSGADPMSRLGRFTGYERFRRESPYTRTGFGSGPMNTNVFAPSARWITY